MSAFGPDELTLLRSVLDDAVDRLPIVQRTSAVKSVLAKKIIACASHGERDPVRLRTTVLTQFKTEALVKKTPAANVLANGSDQI